MSFKRTTTINKILKLKKRVKCIKGSSSAGKTIGILAILIDRCLKKNDLRVSVVSENMPHLKKGAIRDFIKVLKLTKRWNAAQWNKTNSTYTFRNDSYIEFFSADIDGKVHGPRRDVLYVNECNRIDFEVYKQLAKRTELEIFLDWNPVNEFWFDDEIKNDDDVDFITVTYLDNESCPEAAKDEIIKSRNKAFHNPELPLTKLFNENNIKNQYWVNDYRVYGLGLTGHLQGTIFPDWSEGEWKEGIPSIHGMDFGYDPDPSVLLKIAIDRVEMKMYLKLKVYEKELSIDDLAKRIKENQDSPDDIIVADSSGKMYRQELRKKNINVVKGNSNEGAVKLGYKGLMDWHMVICGDEEDRKIIKECFNNHVWGDKKAGIPKNTFKHIPDCMRYGWEQLVVKFGC